MYLCIDIVVVHFSFILLESMSLLSALVVDHRQSDYISYIHKCLFILQTLNYHLYVLLVESESFASTSLLTFMMNEEKKKNK